jgi:hypothetical protein
LIALADDVPEGEIPAHFLTQAHILLPQVLPLLGLAQGQQDFVGLERLGDIVVGPALHGFHGRVQVPVGGHHDHRGLHLPALERLQQLQPVHLGHDHVQEDEIEKVGLRQAQRLLPAPGGQDLIPFPLEDQGKHVAHGFFVVDDQNFFLFHVFPHKSN